MTNKHDSLIVQVANAYGLPCDLLRAQVEQESSGDEWALRFEPAFWARYVKNNPDAKAGRFGPFAACSCGLLQIMVETAYEDGFEGRPEELFSPRVGLTWGVKHLSALLAWAEGDYAKALAAYNAGRGGAESATGKAYAEAVYAKAGRAVELAARS
jgi:hypothetical protein